MANLRKTTKKIQTALATQGRFVRINQRQYYSADRKKFCTIYSVVEKTPENLITHYEGSSFVQVVTTLAEILNGGD